ncbi:hypothetical protein EUX98_g5295 [Antrodiella citrinella]|uniref:Cytochrome P450 n=1 Tax=Antrodiella citrinella TaxID=2447956 RepID=A0A4S4MUM5_9APHY|nr:hypothetical protein EUX98_g5295 [Antrodiella citrinella]
MLKFVTAIFIRWNSSHTFPSIQYAHTKGIFKVALPDQWLVVVAGPQHLEDLKRMSEDQISNYGGLDELLAGTHQFGAEFVANPYHLPLIQAHLNRNLSDFHPVLKDEMWAAFRDCIGSPDDYTLNVSRGRLIINLFPSILKPIVAKLVNKVPSLIMQMKEVVGPTIEQRREQAEQALRSKDEWENKPSVTQALYHLAADPSLAVPLREELEAVLAEEHGDLTSKTAVSKLKKMDSFLKESQRLNGPNATSIWRKTLQPITFSSGITVPADTYLCATALGTHLDEHNYKDATEFNPWRSVDEGAARGFASTTTDYIAFGQGRHRCPGRHFAAYVMKLMMAYIVLHYDVELDPAERGVRPASKWISNTIIPNTTANVLLRGRKAIADIDL